MAITPPPSKKGASGKYKTYQRGESGTASGTGGGTPQASSSYPQVESAREGGSGGGGGSYQIGGVTVTPKENTSYPNVAIERENLVKEAASEGTATTKQLKEANTPNITKDKQFQALVKQVEEYDKELKRQGIQNTGELIAATRGERSPRTSSYDNVIKELQKKREPKQFTQSPFYTSKEIGAREEAVIKVAEFAVKKEQERAERYQAFEQRIEPLNAFQKGGLKLGYAVSVGFGEALASTALKSFVFTGALLSPTLRQLATTELKGAANETITLLKEEYNPKTVKGITNIGLTALAIYGLGRYRAAQRAAARNAVIGEPTVKESVKAKFNLKDKEVSATSGKVINQETQTKFYTKTGEQVTEIAKAGKPKVTGEILTEKGSITTPKPGGKTTTTLYPEKPGAKITIQYAASGQEGITTTLRKGVFYNYERLSYTRTTPPTYDLSPLGYKYAIPGKTEVISRYYKINKLTGARTYLGAAKSANTAEIALLEPRAGEPLTYQKGGANPSLTEKSTIITEGLSKKRAGLKLEIKTETITKTEASSVPSSKPGINKKPAQQPGAIVKKTPEGVDTTPFKTKIKITKEATAAAQPSQNVKIDLENPSITTTTPAIIKTTTQQASQSTVRLSFNNKNILSVVDTPLSRVTRFARAGAESANSLFKIRFAPSKPETPLFTVKITPELQTVTRTVSAPVLQTPAPPPPPKIAIPPDTTTQASALFTPVQVYQSAEIAPPQIKKSSLPGESPSLILQGDILTDYKREIINPPTNRLNQNLKAGAILEQELSPRNKLSNRAVLTLKQSATPAQKTSPALLQEQVTRQAQVPAQVIRLPKPTTPPEVPGMPPPPGGFYIDRPEPVEREEGVFKTLVRKKGQFQVIGTSKSEAAAKRLGELTVKKTAAASYKIESEGNVLETSPGFGFTRSKKERGVIIQPRERRISTSGEKAEITFKGIRSNKIKKKRRNTLELFGGF